MNGNFDISNQICEAKYDKTFTTNRLISLFSYMYTFSLTQPFIELI